MPAFLCLLSNLSGADWRVPTLGALISERTNLDKADLRDADLLVTLRGFGQLADLVAKVKFVDGIDEREIRRKAA